MVGAKLWNELDSNLRNIKTILLFKNKFKWGVLPTYVSHDWESWRWKTLFDDCNLEGFSFKQS